MLRLLRSCVLHQRQLYYIQHQILNRKRRRVLPRLSIIINRSYGRRTLVMFRSLPFVSGLRRRRIVILLPYRVLGILVLRSLWTFGTGRVAGMPLPHRFLAARRAAAALLLVGQRGLPISEAALQVQTFPVRRVVVTHLVRRLPQTFPHLLPVGPQLREGASQLVDVFFGPFLHRTESPLDAIETGRTALGDAAGDVELREEGLANFGREVLETLREGTEALNAPSGVGAHGQGAVGVARSDALAPAGIADATIRWNLVFSEAVLVSLAGSQRTRLKLGTQLRVADDAVTLRRFFWNDKKIFYQKIIFTSL